MRNGGHWLHTPRLQPPRVRAKRGFKTGNATDDTEAAQAETPLCMGLPSLCCSPPGATEAVSLAGPRPS